MYDRDDLRILSDESDKPQASFGESPVPASEGQLLDACSRAVMTLLRGVDLKCSTVIPAERNPG